MDSPQCSVCSSQHKDAVNREIDKGVSLRKIARDFGFAKSNVQRHNKHLSSKEAQEIPNGS